MILVLDKITKDYEFATRRSPEVYTGRKAYVYTSGLYPARESLAFATVSLDKFVENEVLYAYRTSELIEMDVLVESFYYKATKLTGHV